MRLNSFDEWSPLREVVVGSAAGYARLARHISFATFVTDNVTGARGYYPVLAEPGRDDAAPSPHASLHQRFAEELAEDVEGMAELLASLSVTVHRPLETVPEDRGVATLAWSAAVTPPLNVRDNTLILGDEIIETPPTLRARYFENLFLAPVFRDYFRDGARWTVMPRPVMTDASFDVPHEGEASASFRVAARRQPSPFDIGPELMMDAANCLRLGRDLVVNIATSNHAMACDWLERHLAGRFRIHRIRKLTQSHVDSMVLALRPGTLLVRNASVLEYLPKALQSWTAIVPPTPDVSDYPQYPDGYPIPPSPYLDLNVLSLDESTVLVNDACKGLIATLESHRFTVVPVRHRHRRLFAGGLHCFTLDTVRAGGAEDYLS